MTLSVVTVRPATREDIATFAKDMEAPTLRGWVGEVDGKSMALGGFACAKGRWIGFLDVTEEGRGLLKKNMYVRAALIRAAVTALREARKQGIRFLYAKADMNYPRADEMLEKLGFHIDPRSQTLYRWTP